MGNILSAKDQAVMEATKRIAEELAEQENARLAPPVPKNRKPYVWNSPGSFARIEDGLVVKYIKGDRVELTPKEAFHVKGHITTLGGLHIPPSKFDGMHHPKLDERPAMTPQQRAAAEKLKAEAANAESATFNPDATADDVDAADDEAEAARIAEEARRARTIRAREVNG